jgi:ubiquinone/menaquinone biosynthesis C-methylase UbiE
MTGGKRTFKHEKLARIYDEEILPIWSHRFGRMMLRGLEVPAKAMVLDVACGTGYPTQEILRKLDDGSRMIAIDSSSAMLDVARRKLGELGGKRLFFRTENAFPRLSFASDVYDLVLCNLGLSEAPDVRAALADFARVTKPGGQVVCTLPLHGTWGEFYDIYREVLVKHDKHETLVRLEQHLRTYPQVSELEAWMRNAGLEDVRVDVEGFSLLFRSSREFFFAPMIEFGPLSTWKAIAGKGQELQDVFWYIKQAIDAYFGDRAFQITVKAGCARGVKTGAAASVQVAGSPPPKSAIQAHDEAISVQTGEVEMLDAGGEVEVSDADVEEELEAFKDDESGGSSAAASAASDASSDEGRGDPDGDRDEDLTPTPGGGSA